ncbi:MAG: 4-(cytidine 5'-diphospho)-2-C-methyl-D-erythritol kinase [Silicimonas sp.]|jgi:4-diphosphocytidyl-2-C-methyl-D-erythritol kinase|nr:4-(cytidine 5'-diphospho)-2-C-methyl-D-erythritol kinase [Silicimonas sp.]
MTTVEVFAPAKINLTLHVTGQREDGYHLLDSLVAFAGVGDLITIAESALQSFDVTGLFGPGIPDDDENLALRAARLVDLPQPVAITLEKRLPPASGIGGGSADAAAAFRGALALQVPHIDWDNPAETFSEKALGPMVKALVALGADVPMCLQPHSSRVRGIGERIEFLRGLPDLPAVLVTPPNAVRTPDVFRALENKTNPPMPESIPEFVSVEDCAGWLKEQRNDLQEASTALLPVIADVIEAIEAQPGVLIARMSGSGATCFGVFRDWESAEAAASAIFAASNRWWVAACILGGQFGRAMPKFS